MPSFSETWLPYIYLYVVGGTFFVAGIIIARKSNALDLSQKRHKLWYNVMVFGFFYFMLFHALLIIAALYW